MKKILFIVNSLEFFLSHRKPIADYLISIGFEVHLAASNQKKIIPPANIKWHEISLERGGTKPTQEFTTFFAIFKLVKKIQPNIIHLVSIKPVLYAGLISHLFPRISVVYAISGLGSIFTNSHKFRILRFLIQTLYKLALRNKNSIIIFQNNDDQNTIISLTNFNRKNTVLIKGSGVDLNLFTYSDEPSTKNGIIVTMASRLLKDKGTLEFIEASQKLKSDNIKFQLIGDIDSHNPESLSEIDLNNFMNYSNLTIKHHQTNIQNFFKNSHIVVLPSYREGLPKVLCEAAACGRPVVTTNVPGCKDAITDDSGILVPSKNALALATEIKNLSVSELKRKKMGIAGRNLAEQEFDINVIVSKHVDLYFKLLDKNE